MPYHFTFEFTQIYAQRIHTYTTRSHILRNTYDMRHAAWHDHFIRDSCKDFGVFITSRSALSLNQMYRWNPLPSLTTCLSIEFLRSVRQSYILLRKFEFTRGRIFVLFFFQSRILCVLKSNYIHTQFNVIGFDATALCVCSFLLAFFWNLTLFTSILVYR